MCVSVNIFKLGYLRNQCANHNEILSEPLLGWGKLGFGLDRIGTLVSMATDSSHRVIMGKCCQHSSAFIFDRIFFILAGKTAITLTPPTADERPIYRPIKCQILALFSSADKK